MTRATPEQMQAAVDAELGKKPPAEVMAKFKTIVEAGTLGMASFIPDGGTRVYHVLIVPRPDGGFEAVGVLPQLPVGVFLRLHDEWMDALGSAESDPDYIGVKM